MTSSSIAAPVKRYLATFALATVLAGLGVYVYYVELPAERTQAQIDTQEKRLLAFEERDVSGLTVRSDAGEVVLTADASHKWRITAPIITEADAREVEAVLRALLLGRVSRVVGENGAALAPFGLEHPSAVLTVIAGSRHETISIGDTGPISSTLYAMRVSDRRVLLTDLAAKDVLNKTLLTFRKKEVLPFDPGEVERLRLTYPPTEIVLHRDDKPDKGKWMLRFPLEAPADQTEVRTFLFTLQSLKALGFVDEEKAKAALLRKLGQPDAKISVYSGGTERTVRLYRPDKASGEAYAVTASDAPVYRIAPTVLAGLTRDLFALRDKRLLGMDRPDLVMLAVKTRSEHYVLINQNHEWVLEDQPTAKINQEVADLFVSRVVNLPAELLVVKQAGPLAPYGLSSPTAEFTATARDGKQRGRLVLGNKTGGLVYALGQGLPGVYQARADLLDQIPSKGNLLSAPETDSGGAS